MIKRIIRKQIQSTKDMIQEEKDICESIERCGFKGKERWRALRIGRALRDGYELPSLNSKQAKRLYGTYIKETEDDYKELKSL